MEPSGVKMVAPGASPEEAAAVTAALEQFIRDHAGVVEEPAPRVSGWQAAALREGVDRAGPVGPHPPPFWA